MELARALSPQLAWELETGQSLAVDTNTGDGIVMALACGASLSAVGGTIGVPRTTVGSGALAPGIPSIPGIWVNAHGQRFVNEGTHYSYAVRNVFSQERHTAWAIFDQTVRELGGAALGGIWGPLSTDLSEELSSGAIQTAPTLAELAAKLGVNEVQLPRTVEQWNADCKKGAYSAGPTPCSRSPRARFTPRGSRR
jgi:succinate dehydrogenase/fumarate reductase flavoprotein subunit